MVQFDNALYSDVQIFVTFDALAGCLFYYVRQSTRTQQNNTEANDLPCSRFARM